MSFFSKFLSCRVLIAQLLVALISLPVNSATLTGTDGDDTLLGYSGDDQFTSGEGSDVLIGYGGDDTFSIDGVGDKTIDGGPGDDNVSFLNEGISDLSDFEINFSNSTLSFLGPNGDQILLSSIEKFVFESAVYSLVEISLSGYTRNALVDYENQVVFSFDDRAHDEIMNFTSFGSWEIANFGFVSWEDITIVGSTGSQNIFLGGSRSLYTGNYQVDMGAGDDRLIIVPLNADTINMGSGNDYLRLEINQEYFSTPTFSNYLGAELDGGEGIDTISFMESRTNGEILTLTTGGATNFENIEGTISRITGIGDVIFGDNNNNTIKGLTGDDILYGRAGDDLIYAEDKVCPSCPGREEEASEQTFNDFLYGQAGNDILVGSAGDNILDGGSGSDKIITGTGLDTIIIRTGDGGDSELTSDIITDFEDGKDIIELQGISYSDLIITQGENDYLNDVIVQHAGEYLLVIQNTQLSSINYLDFVTTEPADSDDDGVPDHLDAFPLDAAETADIDGDGIGDNSDTDADNDGLPNDYETANGLNPVDASDAQSDSDMDGLTALEEFNLGTSLTNDDTDRDTLPDGWEVENGRDPLVADYQISLGFNSVHSCALDDTGVVCWGRGWNGYHLTDEPSLINPTQVSGGSSHTCALDDTGVVCWGWNGYGQNNVPTLSNPTQVFSGGGHTCALDDTGVVCWGRNNYGQTDVPLLSNPTQVSLSHYHSCALDDTGVVCWGDNEYGQTDVPLLSNPTQVSLGWGHSCALDDSGVVCWGSNNYGQIDVPNLINPIQVSSGDFHICAIDDSGVVCWGRNDYGQNNVPGLSNHTQISAGGYQSCALDDTGVVCWGWNYYGQTDVPNLMIDPDGDGISNQNGADPFPLDATEWLDTDTDGIGNNTDGDDDGDGIDDQIEILLEMDPLIPNYDIDNDGITNELDTDTDNDGVVNEIDVFPFDSSEQLDHDNDGIGNNADADDDNDNVMDVLDIFPLDAFESADSDGDGVGDNADFFPNSAEYSLDSDLDQMPDEWERKYGLNPTDASDALLDQDNDGLTALEEYEAGTIPLKILDIDANGSVDALTDALIILRYLFGLRGQALINGAIADNAMRTEAADVEAYIQSLMPSF
jgi:Ca2+-binding RTX toxin-like protein